MLGGCSLSPEERSPQGEACLEQVQSHSFSNHQVPAALSAAVLGTVDGGVENLGVWDPCSLLGDFQPHR